MSDAELQNVRNILSRHRKDIETRYRAEGTAIGKGSRGLPRYVIVVYLKSESDKPELPASIEGVPLEFKVTGSLTLLDSQR
jgi:hypothetical protein